MHATANEDFEFWLVTGAKAWYITACKNINVDIMFSGAKLHVPTGGRWSLPGARQETLRLLPPVSVQAGEEGDEHCEV